MKLKLKPLGLLVCLSLLVATWISGWGKMEKRFTNSLGVELVRIEPGSFMMGQATGGDYDVRPVHKVDITKAFYMAVTEVTNARYEMFDPEHKKLRGRNIAKGDNEAVVNVSWHDAMAFCEWLSEKEGRKYRLPTEAEWEYACRAGTTTDYYTGDELPEIYRKNQEKQWKIDSPEWTFTLEVRQTPPNALGVYDMHGNVEEWCYDWYGPYESEEARDPVGRVDGDFKVARGGSHSVDVSYLKSANRMGTLPGEKHTLLGFRVVMGELPKTEPLPVPAPEAHQLFVAQRKPDWSKGPDPDKPYFDGPYLYVKIPPNSDGPLYSIHSHYPGLAACPNGDLLATWYTCKSEMGRELSIAASRLRYGLSGENWEKASPFWDAPDRNDHASIPWNNGKGVLYHFQGAAADAYQTNTVLAYRTSTDSGATWSKAKIMGPTRGMINPHSVMQTKEGTIIVTCDANPASPNWGAAYVSPDGGKTWEFPADNIGLQLPDVRYLDLNAKIMELSKPLSYSDFFPWSEKAGLFRVKDGKVVDDKKLYAGDFPGKAISLIAGQHAGIVQLKDGRIMAFGRYHDFGDRMPMSISSDLGRTWTYHPSEFPGIAWGQRMVLKRLREGPILFISFTDSSRTKPPKGMIIRDAAGKERRAYGLFAALSFDEGKSWPIKKLITSGGPQREIVAEGDKWKFIMDDTHSERRGYLYGTQTPDGIIQLISSRFHYQFNLAWLKKPMPAK